MISYASIRTQLPDIAFSLNLVSGTTTVGGTYNIYLSGENRAGLNKLSNPKQIAIAPGEGIEIILNSSAIESGEDPFYLVISVETTGNPEDAVRVANWKVKEDNQILKRSLPDSIVLGKDEHFNLNRVAASINELPSSDLLDGAIAFVAENNSFYRYDSEAIEVDGQLLSYGAPVDGVGNWIRYYGTDKTFTTDTTTTVNGVPGCDRSLSSATNAINAPVKKLIDLDSTPINYWINNGFAVDGGSPIINGVYQIAVFINELDYTGVFNNLIKYKLLGYCDRATGVLDSTVSSSGELKIWNQSDPIKLPVELPRNNAAVYEIYLSFDNSAIAGQLPAQFNSLEFNIFEYGNNTGQLDSSANIFGNLVYSDRFKLLIVPNKRLPGIATIKIPDSIGYRIDTGTEQPINNLPSDSSDLVAAISGAANGMITIRSISDTLQYSEAIRALISTEPGISKITSSEAVALSSNKISVTITHPVNNLGKGIIRSDYPDPLIAGNEQGTFNPLYGRIFLDIDGSIYESSLISVVATASQPQQTINLDIADLSPIPSLPGQPNNYFGLFKASQVELSANGAGGVSGTVTAYWVYSYESPNTAIVIINHQGDDCIPTLTEDLSNLLLRLSNSVVDVEPAQTTLVGDNSSMGDNSILGD